MNERQVYQMKKYRTRCYVHLTIGLIKLQCGWSLNDAALFILPPGSGGHGPPRHFQTNQRKTRFLHPRSSVQLIYKTPDGQQSEKTNYGRLKRCLKEHNLLSQNGILFYFDRIVLLLMASENSQRTCGSSNDAFTDTLGIVTTAYCISI